MEMVNMVIVAGIEDDLSELAFFSFIEDDLFSFQITPNMVKIISCQNCQLLTHDNKGLCHVSTKFFDA